MIENYDLNRGITVDGYPFLFLKGNLTKDGVVCGHVTLRDAKSFVTFNATSLLDVVILVRSSMYTSINKLVESLYEEFNDTNINFYTGDTNYAGTDYTYLIFEREDCDDVFALSTSYYKKGESTVFTYDNKGFNYQGDSITTNDIPEIAGNTIVILAFERSLAQRLNRDIPEIFDILDIQNDNLMLDNKTYIVALISLEDIKMNSVSSNVVKPGVVDKKENRNAYYGSGSYLAASSASRQTAVEPTELKGIQLISYADFAAMDKEGIYQTVPRIGEFPEDEVGETWFYLNKKCDSFVEVYHADSDRVYVIKAMDPQFFSRVALGMNKQESIKLVILVKDIEVLATFLTKFGHKEMVFDMQALPNKSVEVSISVATGWIAHAKLIARDLIKGEAGYGKTKYDKAPELKKRKGSFAKNAKLIGTGSAAAILITTPTGNSRMGIDNKNQWTMAFANSPPGTVHDLSFESRHPEVDAMAANMRDNGWNCDYEQVDGRHIYHIYDNKGAEYAETELFKNSGSLATEQNAVELSENSTTKRPDPIDDPFGNYSGSNFFTEENV